MRRLLLARLAPGLLALAAVAASLACQTSDSTRRSLAAKATNAACDKDAFNSRRDCEDLPGCYWNNDTGHCAAE